MASRPTGSRKTNSGKSAKSVASSEQRSRKIRHSGDKRSLCEGNDIRHILFAPFVYYDGFKEADGLDAEHAGMLVYH